MMFFLAVLRILRNKLYSALIDLLLDIFENFSCNSIPFDKLTIFLAQKKIYIFHVACFSFRFILMTGWISD